MEYTNFILKKGKLFKNVELLIKVVNSFPMEYLIVSKIHIFDKPFPKQIY